MMLETCARKQHEWRSNMITIRDILDVKGKSVHTTTASAKIDDAVVEMCRVKAGALLVLDDDDVAKGVLSERDLLIRVLLAHRDPATTTVGDVMTPRVFYIDEARTITDAMATMTAEHCRHLPVLSDGKVAGLVSIGDLVRAISSEEEHELRALREYVEGRYPG
jgi:signal-transduction protein with cAMP-binding, CBS, and nucleotidyltransferase domain